MRERVLDCYMPKFTRSEWSPERTLNSRGARWQWQLRKDSVSGVRAPACQIRGQGRGGSCGSDEAGAGASSCRAENPAEQGGRAPCAEERGVQVVKWIGILIAGAGRPWWPPTRRPCGLWRARHAGLRPRPRARGVPLLPLLACCHAVASSLSTHFAPAGRGRNGEGPGAGGRACRRAQAT